MQPRRFLKRKPRFSYTKNSDAEAAKRKLRFPLIIPLLFLALVCVFISCCVFFLKDLSTQIAISDASDVVTVRVNTAIAEIMDEGDFDADYFVSMEKNSDGEITAISSNMARVNYLSALILDRIVGVTENHNLEVKIPLGNLTGMSLLMGKGPMVPVEIVVLTSSRVEFNNSIVTAGINQTKHQINLEVIVDIDILIPWDTESSQVKTEVLIADTIVVGKVPDTYLSINK